MISIFSRKDKGGHDHFFQVTSRTADRDNEREKVAALKTELHTIARAQEGRQDLAR